MTDLKCPVVRKYYNKRYHKKWYAKNKAKTLKQNKEWKEANSLRYKELKKEWYEKNKVKVLKKNRAWKKANKEAVKQYGREYQREYIKTRRKNDYLYKLNRNLRKRVYALVSSKKWEKNFSITTELGCTGLELKEYLEKQFTEGMSWDNYGQWHLDHINPLANAKTEEELIKRCHYTNLQPLWAKDNIKKSNKEEV